MRKKLDSNKKPFYPVSSPYITKKDIESVNRVLKRGWISSDGPEIKKFEKEFSRFVDKKYSVAVSSGTAALEIAIKALDIKKNDEVLIPNFTIISNALAVIRQQARPVLIDCNLKDWNIKIEDIEKNISKKTKAIIITHIYSFPNEMQKILKICKKYNLLVIEDAAEVLGLKYKNKMCGSFGDISTFSFYANKQVTSGEGGMLSMNSLQIYETSPSESKSLKLISNKKIIQAIKVKKEEDINLYKQYLGVADEFLFDSSTMEKSSIFDWSYLKNIKIHEWFLAGGININNLEKASSISKNIDISSCLEDNPGVKSS